NPWIGLFIGTVVVPTTLCVALAVHYHARQFWLRCFMSFVSLAVVGMGLRTLPFFPWAFAAWLALLAITIAWWFSLRPRMERDWAVGMEALPKVELRGTMLHVQNFRNF